jgi:uncharacterized membrane protein YcgQ (UPF0703/DUF1980 family)
MLYLHVLQLSEILLVWVWILIGLHMSHVPLIALQKLGKCVRLNMTCLVYVYCALSHPQ